MNRRLLAFALGYCVFAVVLLLLPPFHDGRHHLYNWHPVHDAQINEVLSYAGPAARFPQVFTVSPIALLIEAAAGLFVALGLFFALELWPSLAPHRRPAATLFQPRP